MFGYNRAMSSTEVVAYTGLIIAFIATLFTALQWASAYRAADSARRSAKAAEDAAAIAKEMGQHSTRPWVTLRTN